jgi:hypothetical protein
LQFRDGTWKRTRLSFSALSVPACAECNSNQSVLEDNAKEVVGRMCDWEAVGAADVDVLLDWLDKVRIGVWYYSLYVAPFAGGVKPKFGVGYRLGTKDRAVVVYRADFKRRGLRAFGCDFPSFQHFPCCFALSVMDTVFCNISFDFLFSERMGFPYALGGEGAERQGETKFYMKAGRERIRLPLIDNMPWKSGVTFWQPCFLGAVGEATGLYNTRYVKEKCLDPSAGKGLVFMEKGRTLDVYPPGPSTGWVPDTVMDGELALAEVVPGTYELQLRMLNWSRRHLRMDEADLAYMDELGRQLRKLVLYVREEFRGEKRSSKDSWASV